MYHHLLTHWCLNKMAVTLQMTISNAFSWMKMFPFCLNFLWRLFLTHWGRGTHICVGNLTIIGSDNGLSPGRRQAIIWINVRILLIGPLGTNFIEMLIEIHTFSFKKIHLKMSSGKCQPFCLGLNVLRVQLTVKGHWSTLVLVMACHLFNVKPLPKPMLTQFTDEYIHGYASMSRLRINKILMG